MTAAKRKKRRVGTRRVLRATRALTQPRPKTP